MRALRNTLTAIALLAALSASAQTSHDEGYIAALSDGGGNVTLFWTVPQGAWPATGYVLERVPASGTKQVVARGLRPGYDASQIAALPATRQEPLRRLDQLDRQAASGKVTDDFQGLKNFLFLSSLGDLPLAKAMGLAFEDRPDSGGVFTYRLLDAAGKSVSTSLPVDPGKATPQGPPPPGFTAEATPDGVRLDWGKPRPGEDAPIPVLAFRVMRDDGAGFAPLGSGPLLGAGDKQRKEKGLPRYLDEAAPQGREVRYTVVGIDIFGRDTAQAPPVAVAIPDYTAMRPPAGLAAEAGPGKVALTWKVSANRATASYSVERSLFPEGPFTALSNPPIPREVGRFEDTTLKPGQRAYYRVVTRDREGRQGAPSAPVVAVGRSARPPEAPANLRATLGAQRVALAWDAVPGASGYRLERADGGSDRWTPVSTRLALEPRYDDPLVTGQGGALRYRVVAVAGDDAVGAPSAVLEVPLPRNRPPAPPRITGFDGAGGQVVLTFEPAGDSSDSAGFFVVRSTSLAAPQEILHSTPLPASARTYTDAAVLAGEQYVYRVVAVDGAFNRSEASDPATVRVGEALLGAPPPPAATFGASGLPKVTVTFQPAPGGNLAFVQRLETDGKSWRRVAGPLPPGVGQAADLKLPTKSGRLTYRVYYQTPAGTPGPPSPPVEVTLPGNR